MKEQRLDPFLDIRRIDKVPVIGMGTFVYRNIMDALDNGDVQYAGFGPFLSKEGLRQRINLFEYYAIHSSTLALIAMAAESYFKR